MAEQPEDWGAVPATPQAPSQTPDEWGAIPASSDAKPTQITRDEWGGVPADMVDDEKFDPAAHAAQHPEDADAAYAIYSARKNQGLGQWAKGIGKAAINRKTYVNMGKGLMNLAGGVFQVPADIAAHSYYSATGNPAALTKQAEATIEGQRGEGTFKNLAETIGSVVDAADPSTWLYQSPKMKEDAQRLLFNQRVQQATHEMKLANGIPLDTGAIAGIYGARNALGKSVYGSNFPAETPSQEVGPEALKSAGAPPVDQGNIERASAIGDPTMLALAAAPALPGAGYLGGRIAQGAGKLAQIPMDLAERGAGALSHLGPAGRIAAAATGGAGIVPAAMAAAHNPMLAAVVGGSALGLKGLQLLGRAAESQGKELATGIPSAATTEAANAAATGGRAIVANVKRAAGNAITQGASTAVGMAPLNLALSDGDPNQFVQTEAGAGGFGAALGAFARNRPQMVEALRPHLQSEGARALAEAGEGNDPLAQKSAAYVMSLPEEARNRTLETIGALQGLPTNTPDGQQRAKVYVLNDSDYRQVLADKFGQQQAAMGGGRGFYLDNDGKAYVNGDYHSGLDPSELSHTVGHEFGGHAAINIMRAAGAKGGALHDGLMKTVAENLMPGGRVSPEFYRFIADYNRAFDPTGQTKRLDPRDPEAMEEWISEQAGQITAGKGAGEIALPRNLQDKINDGIGRFMGGLLGMDTRKVGTETHFGREEVGAITKAVQDTLEQVVGMKLRGGAEIPEPAKTDTTRIAELNQILSTPRPPAGTPVTQVHQWIREQRAARTELNQLQEGLQPSFPAAGAPPTPPSAPTVPATPTAPTVGNKARVAAALRLNGIPAAEAAQWAQQAQGATTEEMVLDALRRRGGQKFPSTPPNSTQVPVNQPEVLPPAATAGQETVPPSTAEEPAISNETQSPPENGKLPTVAETVSERPDENLAATEPLPLHQTPEEFTQIAAKAREQFLSDKETAKSGKNKGQHTAANTKAAEKAAFDAAAAAHAQTVPENYQGLRQRTDAFGKTSVSGKVDPSRPFDAWLIKQAKESGNINDESLKTLLSLQDAIGQTVSYDYGHAPTIDEGDMPTKAGRAGQQAEHTVAKRLSGESPIQTERKTSVPLRVGFNPGSKSFTVYGASQEKLLNNFNHLTEKMGDLGIPAPFRDINDPRFVAAFKAVIANHEHGWTGDGKSPSIGTEEFPNRPDREWKNAPEHHIVPDDQFQFINAILADEGAKPPTRGDATVSKAKAHLANENRRLLNAEGETNPLRQQINEGYPGWTKKTLEDPLNENISPALASNLGPASQSDQSIRQHGKVGDLSRFFPEGKTPNRAKTSAGFLPDTGRPDAVLSKQDERAGYKLFNVNPAKLDSGWKKDPMYVGPDFEGGIKGRKEGIQDWLQKNPAKPMEAASVTVDPDGTISFSNGRHRTRLLMEQGASAIPLAIDPDSIQNARANGLIPTSKEAAMQRIAARTAPDKSGNFMPDTGAPKTAKERAKERIAAREGLPNSANEPERPNFKDAAKARLAGGKPATGSFMPTETMRDDMRDQAGWLQSEARSRGYQSTDEMLAADPGELNKLSARWRVLHPRDEQGFLSQNEASRGINSTLYGDQNSDSTRPIAGTREAFRDAASHIGGGEQAGRSPAEQAGNLRTYAQENELAFSDLPSQFEPGSENDKGGMEHHVWFDPKSGRWIKATIGTGEGMGMVPAVNPDGGWQLKRGSVKDYLESRDLWNKTFGDDIRMHGVWDDGKNVSVVTSQPDISGDPMTAHEIMKAMESAGFTAMGDSVYYRKRDNVAVFDMHEGNAVNAGGVMIPFDGVILHPSEDLIDSIKWEKATGKSKMPVDESAPKPDFMNAARARFMPDTNKPTPEEGAAIRIHPAAIRLVERYKDYYPDESSGAGEKTRIPIEDINFGDQKLEDVSPLSDNRDKPIIVREKDDGYDILDGFGRASGLRNAGKEYANAILVTKGDITDLANGRAGGDDADWNHAVYEKYGLNPQKLSQGNFMPDSKPSREEPAPEGKAPSGSPPNPLSSGGTSKEDSGKPEDGQNAGEKLMREAEAAGLLPSIDVIKGVLKGDSAAYDKLRAMIRDRTGRPARFMPKESARQRILERQKAA